MSIDKNGEVTSRISELLEKLSSDEGYRGAIFKAPGIYFVIRDGEIREISDDGDGEFPDLLTGLTPEQNAFLESVMEELDFDETVFSEMMDCIGELDGDAVKEYFEDDCDEDAERVYKVLEKRLKKGKTPFSSMEQLVPAVERYGLEYGTLYYKWEGEYVELDSNVSEDGEPRGSYEELDDGEWLSILENIDEHVVGL